MISRVAILAHSGKSEAKRLSAKLRRVLARKASVVGLDRAEICFVVGGDGTILRAAPEAARLGVPLVGVNAGRLGFLAELSEDRLGASIGPILAEKFSIEERRMIEVSVGKDRRKARKLGVALNEMLIVREGLSRIAELSIFIGGESAGLFSLDGVIVATPTGSTGHALAAGGPVLAPELGAFLIVPLCPHPPRVRPMVIEEKEVEIAWTGRYPDLRVMLDGRKAANLTSGPNTLRILPSPYTAKFVRLNRREAPSFFHIVREKLI
ncbi:NAD(+)/NADH kinase [bacterium]|nr:NAD(+)/NADH kinase [bacterium]